MLWTNFLLAFLMYMLIHTGVGHASVTEIPLLVLNQLIIALRM